MKALYWILIILTFFRLAQQTAANTSQLAQNQATLSQILQLKANQSWLYIDEHLENIAIGFPSDLYQASFYQRLAFLSRTLPLRIHRDRGLLQILLPSFRKYGEKLTFQASILLNKEQKTLSRLARMHG